MSRRKRRRRSANNGAISQCKLKMEKFCLELRGRAEDKDWSRPSQATSSSVLVEEEVEDVESGVMSKR